MQRQPPLAPRRVSLPVDPRLPDSESALPSPPLARIAECRRSDLAPLASSLADLTSHAAAVRLISLPAELLCHAFSFLSTGSLLLAVSRVNRRLCQLTLRRADAWRCIRCQRNSRELADEVVARMLPLLTCARTIHLTEFNCLGPSAVAMVERFLQASQLPLLADLVRFAFDEVLLNSDVNSQCPLLAVARVVPMVAARHTAGARGLCASFALARFEQCARGRCR